MEGEGEGGGDKFTLWTFCVLILFGEIWSHCGSCCTMLAWGQKECTNYVIPIAIKFGHFLTVWIGTPESECAPPESRVQSSGSVSSERGYGVQVFPMWNPTLIPRLVGCTGMVATHPTHNTGTHPIGSTAVYFH